MANEESLIIATIVYADKGSEANVLLLAGSIRDFAEDLSDVPVWCYVPEANRELSTETRERLISLGCEIVPFQIEQDILRFPFMGHAHAAASAEASAVSSSELLAWLSPNTLVLQEPKEFILRKGISLGYRPVHHKLLGVRYEEPLDPFWTEVYRLCEVPDERVFEMRTQVEDIAIRPYFNAGSLIVRPERGIFQTWRDKFLNTYQVEVFRDHYERDGRYAIFVHQAILSAVILSNLERNETEELPSNYNYPLNLYTEDVTSNRPASLEECVTIRHEGFYRDSNWRDKIPAGEDLKNWILAHLQ